MRLSQLTEVNVEDLEQNVQGLLNRYAQLFGDQTLTEDQAIMLSKAVDMLKQRLLNTEDNTYQGIDALMRDISDQLEIDVHDLHDAFVDAESVTPDEWIQSRRSEQPD